jgi:hypothetical protein
VVLSFPKRSFKKGERDELEREQNREKFGGGICR